MPLKQENYKAGDHRDHMQTPGYAIDPLKSLLYSFSTVWESAAGQGYLSRELEKTHKVISTDILNGYDYFTWQPEGEWDVTVTNPPYAVGLKYKWLERTINLGKPWALLLPVSTLGAGRFQKAVKSLTPAAGIIFMDKRINFKTPNKGWEWIQDNPKKKNYGKVVRSTAQFPTCWVTWGMGLSTIQYYSFDWLTEEKRKEYEYD